MDLKFQQTVETKLEALSKMMEDLTKRMESLERRMENTDGVTEVKFEGLEKRMENVECGATVARMIDEKVESMLKLQSHLQLKQDQLARKQDLLHTTIVGEHPSLPTPSVSSPPYRSPTFSIHSTPFLIVHASSMPSHCLVSQPPCQLPPAAAITAGETGVSSVCEDLDEELLSLLSDPVPTLQQGGSQRGSYSLQQQCSGMNLASSVSHPPVESGRSSCVGSQHSGAMELPPPTGLPLMESERESYSGSRRSGVMELLPPMQDSTSQYRDVVDAPPHRGVSLRPAGEILVEHKGLWNAEGATKLANKLARLCYFGDDVLVQSTLTGREGDALDERRMQALLGDVKHYACGMMTQSEFDVQIRPKVREGISSLCRRLRNLEKKKKRKQMNL